MDFKPLINGTAYSWSQIKFLLFNVPIAGVHAISYSDEQEIQDNHGAGRRVVSRGYGQIKTEASITLDMAEVEALQKASPTGNIMDIPEFDMQVSFLPVGGVIATHTLKNVKFKKNVRTVQRNDMEVPVEIPLAVSEILWK
jgi:hypothetical protein